MTLFFVLALALGTAIVLVAVEDHFQWPHWVTIVLAALVGLVGAVILTLTGVI